MNNIIKLYKTVSNIKDDKEQLFFNTLTKLLKEKIVDMVITENLEEIEELTTEQKFLKKFKIDNTTKEEQILNKDLTKLIQKYKFDLTLKHGKDILKKKGCLSFRNSKSRGLKGLKIIN